MENEQHFFYVLLCKDGSLYAGYTNNLDRRIRLHNEGKGAKYTRGRTPLTLLYAKQFTSKSEALKAEYHFKQLPRQKKLALIRNETGDNNVAAKKL
ncbi:GIY-YIG nuclease family protein [Bacillaceae bacterium Marseille-Q3522]|nr:GIY-YIG nuclease family protein [Bacillaceae bacterium Marseille-Q3522]